MPMVMAVVGAFATGAAGVAAVGAATTLGSAIAGYAMIAGSVLTGVGALTGSKSLMKIGAVLSIGGGIGTALAGSAASTAGNAITDAAKSAPDYVNSLDAMSDAASSASSGVSGIAGGTNLVADSASQFGAAGDAAAYADSPLATAGVTSNPSSISNLAAQNAAQPAGMAGAPEVVSANTPLANQYATPVATPAVSTASTAVKEAAGNMTGNDLATWWQKAQQTGKGVADFLSKNKELVKVGGDMMASMYGPQAERMDMEKSMMERARANLNSPVQLKFNRPGG